MSAEFKREVRYVVLKLKDMKAYLSDTQIKDVMNAGDFISRGRWNDGKPTFNAVVVESDWPEFETVWSLIEARMTKTNYMQGESTVTILRDDLEAVIVFLEGFDFDDDPNAELVREYLARLRAAVSEQSISGEIP